MLLILTCWKKEPGGKPAAVYPKGSVTGGNKDWNVYHTFAE